MKKLIPILLTMPIMLSSCSNNQKADTLTQGSFFGLNTIIEIKAYNKKVSDYDVFKDTINYYSSMFDGFNPNEENNNVYAINNTKEEIVIDEKLYDALKIADSYIAKTNGYFNPYLGELTYKYKNNEEVTENFINSALLHVNSFKMQFNDEKHSVKRLGDSLIDLGAFAKGYLLDELRELASKNDFINYFIDGGTSSYYFTSKPNGSPYTIGIRNTRNYIELKDISLGTSSILDNLGDKNHLHIISPFTGKPVKKYDTTLVINDSATLCDVFSTTLMCVENEDDLSKLVETNNLSYIIYKEGKIFKKSSDLIVKSH